MNLTVHRALLTRRPFYLATLEINMALATLAQRYNVSRVPSALAVDEQLAATLAPTSAIFLLRRHRGETRGSS